MSRTLITTAVVALLTTPAFAQREGDHPITVSLGAGVTVSTGEFAGANALAAQAALSSTLSGPLAWRVEVARDGFGVCALCDDAQIWRFSGGLELRHGDASGLDVYALVTAGAFVLKQSGTSAMRFGASLGGGFNLRLGSSWGVGIDAHLNMRTAPAGSASDWWFSPTAQLYVKL